MWLVMIHMLEKHIAVNKTGEVPSDYIGGDGGH